jgi:hypothetical protein
MLIGRRRSKEIHLLAECRPLIDTKVFTLIWAEVSKGCAGFRPILSIVAKVELGACCAVPA